MRSLWGLAALVSCLALLAPSPLVPNAAAQSVTDQRLSLDEFPWVESNPTQTGSGITQGLRTVFVVGDGNAEGLYSLVFSLGGNAQIAPHSHPDERSCFVLSGNWYFAYGEIFDAEALQMLPPGSNYTEPAGRTHFAETRETGVIVECTAVGPTGTTFVNTEDDPRNNAN
ncbi:MAG: cupin domain-containing protein [Proteobacteria bacterium]|nr:cupin domain-containing protein [Pseudomonadota bacterium]